MAKAITVLAATLLFGLFGLVIGWLNIRAQIRTSSDNPIPDDSLLLSYGAAPLARAIAGFILAVVSIKLFARD